MFMEVQLRMGWTIVYGGAVQLWHDVQLRKWWGKYSKFQWCVRAVKEPGICTSFLRLSSSNVAVFMLGYKESPE